MDGGASGNVPAFDPRRWRRQFAVAHLQDLVRDWQNPQPGPEEVLAAMRAAPVAPLQGEPFGVGMGALLEVDVKLRGRVRRTRPTVGAFPLRGVTAAGTRILISDELEPYDPVTTVAGCECDAFTDEATTLFGACGESCIGHGGLASFDIDGCTSTTMTWGDTKCICIISCGCADGFLPLSDAKMKVFCPPAEETERSWADLIRSSLEAWYESATGGPEFNLVNCIRWSGDEYVGACGGTGEKTDEGTPPGGGCVRLGDGAFTQGSPACPIGINACVVTYTDGSYDITGCPCDPDDAESC